jgi:hypothetical protein
MSRERRGRRDLLTSIEIIVEIGEELSEDRHWEVKKSLRGKERRDVRRVITESIKDNDDPIQLQVVSHEEMKCWSRELILKCLNCTNSTGC